MSGDEFVALEKCRQSLKRIAWRLQYRIRTQTTRELLNWLDYYGPTTSFDQEVISKIYVQELVQQIKEPKGRYIFQRVVIDGMTEKEVAKELEISQQAVSKWKKKGIAIVRENMTRF